MRNSFPTRDLTDDDDDFESQIVDPPSPRQDTSLGDDPLWSLYRLQRSWPLKIKVERLLSLWDLDVSEIASLLNVTTSVVASTAAQVRAMWAETGKGLSSEDSQMARGQMIRQLKAYKAELESQDAQDLKIITLKIKITEQIATLQGLENKPVKPVEDETGSSGRKTAEEQISGLTGARLEALLLALE